VVIEVSIPNVVIIRQFVVYSIEL